MFLSYFFTCSLLCLSFPSVWLFFPSRDSCCWHVLLFLVSFHHAFSYSFHTYPFLQKDLGLCGPNNVDWIKRVLDPICLDLSKPFCWRIVFCDRSIFYSKSVFCGKSVFCYRLLSLALLSLDISCSSVFLVGLAFHWAFFLMGFWIWIRKIGHNIQPFEHMDCSCNSYANTYAVFFCEWFHNSHANASLLFFADLLFQSLLSLGKSFSFLLQIHDLPRIAKKLFFMRVVVLLLSPKSEFVENFASL